LAFGRAVGIVLCGGCISVLALGRVSVWVRLGGALACGRAWPGQTCVLAKNKAPNF